MAALGSRVEDEGLRPRARDRDVDLGLVVRLCLAQLPQRRDLFHLPRLANLVEVAGSRVSS